MKAKKYSGPATTLVPDTDVILSALETLYGEESGGKFALAVADPSKGPGPVISKWFNVDELEEAAEWAAKMNAKPGASAYVRPCVFPDDSAPFGHPSDADFGWSRWAWTETDKYEDTEKAKDRYAACPPHFVTVTSRENAAGETATRAQYYWRLSEPCGEGEVLRATNRALAVALHGDTAVINPTSLMRLPGTINWAWKEGRKVELTEFLPFTGRLPTSVEHLQRCFENVEPKNLSQDNPTRLSHFGLDTQTRLDRESSEAAIKAGEGWYPNMLKLVASHVAVGDEAELLLRAAEFTLPGYSVSDTLEDMGKFIAWAKGRQGQVGQLPGQSGEATQIAGATSLPFQQFNRALDPKRGQPRQFIIPYRMQRGQLTVTFADPGVGKTTLTMEEAVGLAAGEDILGYGLKTNTPLRVFVINNEETRREMEMRVEATCAAFDIKPEKLIGNFGMYSGMTDGPPVVLARRNKLGEVIATDHAFQLNEYIKRERIDVCVLDPFVHLHAVSENSNEEISAACQIIRRTGFCEDHQAAIHVVHHSRKSQAGWGSTPGDMNEMRGGKGIAGVAHFVFGMTNISKEDAMAFSIGPDDEKLLIRVDDAKKKMTIDDTTRWYKRYGQHMPYGLIGEKIGVLLPANFDEYVTELSGYQVDDILREVGRRDREGCPFALKAGAGELSLWEYIAEAYGISEGAAKKKVKQLLNNATLAKDRSKGSATRKLYLKLGPSYEAL